MRPRKHRPADQKDDRFVLFADMLGFAEAVEANKPLRRRGLSILYADELRTHVDWPRRHERAAFMFLNLSYAIDEVIETTRFSGDLTLITFSDSLYFASSQFYDVHQFGAALMHRCLRGGIMIRMGVGYGSFVLFEFSQASKPKQQFNAARFLGHGVVRAFQAESSGIKGARIALHPSAVANLPEIGFGNPMVELMKLFGEKPANPASALANDGDELILKLPEHESTSNARHELNYLKATLQDDSPSNLSDDDLMATVESLSARSPRQFLKHYDDTKTAIARMRNWSDKRRIAMRARQLRARGNT